MAAGRIETVGVVGLGRIGLPVAGHILAAGFGVLGFDRAREAVAAARAGGVRIAADGTDLARRSDAVIVAVGFEGEVEDAIFGAGGVLAGAAPGCVVMIVSTVAPAYLSGLARRLAEHDVAVLDVPVARGEHAAERGELVVFAGGAADILERCRPILDCFAERIHHLGGTGAGQAAKAVNNMLLWTCLCANLEGLALGEALGVEPEALRRALLDGSGANWALETRAEDRPALWAEKDMEIVLAEAAAARLALPVCAAAGEAIAAFKAARGLPRPRGA